MTIFTKSQRISMLERKVDQIMKLLPKPIEELRQLDQSIFNGLDEMWKFAAVDSNGDAYVFGECPEKDLELQQWDIHYTKECSPIDGVFDSTDWENSLIERQANELTGSELCRVMLERGDKYVMCHVGTHNIYTVIITGMCGTSFEVITNDVTYTNPKPINNNGELLTAKDVGL